MSAPLDIDDNRVVAFHYRLSNGFGELIDGSQGDLPLVYMQNTNAILPGLERELTGHRAGDALQVTLYPEDAYGYRDDALVQDFEITTFDAWIPNASELIPGMRIKAMGQDDETKLATVVAVDEQIVRLDANHPLAGQVLYFEISIVAVREPTEAELERGHASSVNP